MTRHISSEQLTPSACGRYHGLWPQILHCGKKTIQDIQKQVENCLSCHVQRIVIVKCMFTWPNSIRTLNYKQDCLNHGREKMRHEAASTIPARPRLLYKCFIASSILSFSILYPKTATMLQFSWLAVSATGSRRHVQEEYVSEEVEEDIVDQEPPAWSCQKQSAWHVLSKWYWTSTIAPRCTGQCFSHQALLLHGIARFISLHMLSPAVNVATSFGIDTCPHVRTKLLMRNRRQAF